MATVVQAFGAAFRSLRRSPGFAFTVVITIAVGIAPNCAVFAIMDAVYFRPQPYPGQDRLALVDVARKAAGTLAPPDARSVDEWRHLSHGFDRLAQYRGAPVDVTAGDRAERLDGQQVSPEFFAVIGVQPAIGRPIAASDCVPGAPPVVVIGHRAWTEIFGARADVIGRAVRIDGRPGAVVGVMPEGFTSFMEGRTAQAWRPLVRDADGGLGGAAPRVIGRLKAGVPLAEAEAELGQIDRGLAPALPPADAGRAVVARDFRSSLYAGMGPGIRMLTVIVGLLMLIACANAANLLLARANERQRDVAVRSALGAGRARLAAALVAESVLLAVAGAGLGLLVGGWGTRLVWSASAPIFLRIGVERFPLDGRVVAFAAVASVVVVALFGIGPALRGSRPDVSVVLRGGPRSGGRGRGGRRLSRALVVAQAALCVVTLLVTALMLRSVAYVSGLAASPGFRRSGLTLATLPAPVAQVSADAGRRRVALAEIERRLASAPGIRSVAVASRLPFLETGAQVSVRRSGTAPDREPSGGARAGLRAVNDGYFATFGVRIRQGRALTADDERDGAKVAVVDERLAADLWGARDAVGDLLVVDGTPRTVVGISAAAVDAPFQRVVRDVLVPGADDPGEVTLVVDAAVPPEAAAAAIRRAVSAVDRDQPVVRLQSMTQALDDFMTPFRLILSLVATFGAAALGLAALGLHGTIARGVSRRVREIGVRVTLGATRRDVVAMIMREGLGQAAVGLAVGAALGAAVTAILPSELLGVGRLPGGYYLATAATWLAAAAVSCAVPARQAAAIAPTEALRCE